jgi:hypothetical protein
LRLARAGWWGGDPDAVGEAPVESVLEAAEMDRFQGEYERAWVEMYKGKEA